MLAVGGVLFWILVSVMAIVLFIVVANEKPGWATVSVVATLALLAWLGNFNLWTVITHQPWWALVFFAAYVVLGVDWSFWKWWFFVTDKKEKFVELRAEYEKMAKDGPKAETGGFRSTHDYFINRLNDLRCGMELNKKPRARDNKARILTWTIYWPWSFVWTIIDDPLKKFFKYIYKKLQAVYQKISDRIYAGVDETIPPLPPKNPPDNKNVPAPGMRERGFVVDDEDSGSVDVKKYIGLSEEMAENAISADGKQSRVMKRDGNELAGDCAYTATRVNLEIYDRFVVGAWIG